MIQESRHGDLEQQCHRDSVFSADESETIGDGMKRGLFVFFGSFFDILGSWRGANYLAAVLGSRVGLNSFRHILSHSFAGS